MSRYSSTLRTFTLILVLVMVTGCSTLIPQPTSTTTDSPTSSSTPEPSPTASLTYTLTPTRTFAPTPTLRRRATRTPPPAVEGPVVGGEWWSHEQSSGTFPAPLLTFHVIACKVGPISVWAFPVPGELYVIMNAGAAPIIDGKFSYTQTGGSGSLIIAGEFSSPTTSQGTITFTKGFFLHRCHGEQGSRRTLDILTRRLTLTMTGLHPPG